MTYTPDQVAAGDQILPDINTALNESIQRMRNKLATETNPETMIVDLGASLAAWADADVNTRNVLAFTHAAALYRLATKP